MSRSTSEKVNGSFAIIGDDDLEAEFPMNSHIARMLYDIKSSTTGKTGNQNQASVSGCSGTNYRSCIPASNGGSSKTCRSDYDRTC
ncbi:uncharacterized protein G2W53_027840 [Senna tora]|uniref:Uncharacterized protein n=1 Tax=Senna tora TaxID=362788 RepID=A0A834TK15_9FABA|nr:uncharacterized protein G2W53_027840 [Senna tora]